MRNGRKKTVKWTPDKIKQLRKALGDNQEEFARRFRVTIHAVQGWEQNKDQPSGPVTVILDQLEEAMAAQDLQTA